MFPDPFVAFSPEVSFFDVKRLFGQRRFARSQLRAGATQGTKHPAQNQKVQQHKYRAGDYP